MQSPHQWRSWVLPALLALASFIGNVSAKFAGRLGFVGALSLSWLALFTWSVMAQTPTPTATPPPWWQTTEDKVPYLILLIIAIAAFIIGGLARPLLDDTGNALLRWVQSLGGAGRFRREYLTWVVNQNRFDRILQPDRVAARAQQRRRAMALENLYTPLSLGGQPTDGMDSDGMRSTQRKAPQHWWQKLWQRIRPPVEPTAGDIGVLIQRTTQLVILGDPGSGKTTLLRYLAISCARSLRNDRREGDDANLAQQRFGWKKAFFPMIVPLSLLSDVGKWSAAQRLLDKMVDTLSPELHKHYQPGFFEQQLRRGHCLVLFDGFDELGSPAARSKMAQLIADFVTTYKHPTNRFVVSSRIVGYEGQLDHYGFSVRTVQELTDDAVRTLTERRYAALALSEGEGLTLPTQEALRQQYADLARDLLEKLQKNRGLRRLTTNPLLLSLIILVHSVKIKLPDERHLLYRDCVEILTEGWREFRLEQVGLAAPPRAEDELTFEHKLTLLHEIALMIQKQRRSTMHLAGDAESQALIRRDRVEALIAARLPRFIAAHFLPDDEPQRQQACAMRACALLDNVRMESGILTEKGFDDAGEPVVGFSHLTFQEYLAADAIRETPAELPTLLKQLFNPTWREVLLLYVGMIEAGEVIQACLEDNTQHLLTRYLLAGRCLGERMNLPPHLRQQVLDGLHTYFYPPADQGSVEIQKLLAQVGGEKFYDWLIGNLVQQMTPAEQQLFATPPIGATFYTAMQQCLARLTLSAVDTAVRYSAGCILSGIGDPRNLAEMVAIPAGPFTLGSEVYDSEKPVHSVQLEAYRISKYPVTNAQYQRFVSATGHPAPRHWRDGKPAPWLATHPVVYVSWYDTQAYCQWLTQTTAITHRLPTEAEWEKAARGTDAREYPWGNEFDPKRTNSYEELGDWQTTPVGMYPQGASPYDALDMAGNVWEWTNSKYMGYPYNPEDGREVVEGGERRVLRGGAFLNGRLDVRCAYRGYDVPGSRSSSFGFRVVAPGSGSLASGGYGGV